jgi:muramoyltetrapeptide carboxypeptidase
MIAPAAVQKPKALHKGSRFAPVALASPAPAERIEAGRKELARLGFVPNELAARNPEGYFAGSAEDRREEFLKSLKDPESNALIATRGGFGSVYLLEEGLPDHLPPPKPLVGFSDLTTLQVYLWQKHRWSGFYGPMLGAGLDGGAGASGGYDQDSFMDALTRATGGWTIPLQGEALEGGTAEGTILGGALTLLEATIGSPWEIDTNDAIVILEDRAMKPYQIDRVLIHLKHAGKFKNVRGFVLGDFPECGPPAAGSPSVRDVCARILAPLGVPIVFSTPFGHTTRPMLTIPLGVRARLVAEGSGTLEILEPAVVE